ncbi:MAG: ThuA domain-containing protein, partial [bacterium]
MNKRTTVAAQLLAPLVALSSIIMRVTDRQGTIVPKRQRISFFMSLLWCCILMGPMASGAELKALLVTGYDPHGHKWDETTPILEGVLQHRGKFDVEIVKLSSPQEAQAFAPDFGKFNVVVVYAHGRDWSAATQERFEKYLNGGGNLVVVHNAVGQFATWSAYRAMIGIGAGSQQDGVGFKFDESTQTVVQIPSGEGVKQNGHGSQHEWVVKIREQEHPITAGLPQAWMHTADELYHGFRGKPEHIKNLKVLATAFSAKETGGTGEHEPVMVVNQFGKGRIFQIMLGHSAGSMSCTGFQTVFLRGTEWAATGKVTLTNVPADFPTAGKSSARPAVNKSSTRKIVFIGGADTHGPGAHAHKAGATLLKQLVDTSDDFKGIATALYLDRLPEDLAELDDAAAIVLMWEGWEQHLFQSKNVAVMNKFSQLMQRGVGLMCLHAATAVGDEAEKEFLKWSGGNKKVGYSSHPMTNNLELSIVTPEHPICRGVKTIRFAREEFYSRILGMLQIDMKVVDTSEDAPA